MGTRRGWTAIITALFAMSGAAEAPAQTQAAHSEQDATAETKREAKEHFERGMDLLRRMAWEPALAEFLRSRTLFPTRANTQNAAVALNHLERYDEALDMFETLVREFPNLPDRAQVDQEIKLLRTLVGTIEVRLGAAGATIILDGKARGTSPLAGPLRVSAGSHVVRVFKEGAAEYETRVDVAGGENRVVEPKLAMLTRAGRLRVVERQGKTVEVVVDGALVGKTPWEGSLAPGSHTVILRGPGNQGTQPVQAPVRDTEDTLLTLGVELLDCTLRVDPVPLSAHVALDAIDLGRGTWEGRLRCGAHRIEVGAEGFVSKTTQVALVKERRVAERIELERDPDSPIWAAKTPPRVFAELAFGLLAAPLGVGGDLWNGCSGGCDRSLPLGFDATLYGGYQFSSGVGLAVAVGFLGLETKTQGRSVGAFRDPATPDNVAEDDRLILSGLTLGIAASLERGQDWPVLIRFGSGVLLGRVADRRSASFDTGGYGPRTDRATANYLYVAPEIRVGPRWGSWQPTLGLRPMLLMGLTTPTFPGDSRPLSSSSSLVHFKQESLAGSVLFAVEGGLSLRYSFL